jgi:hypothetical protein
MKNLHATNSAARAALQRVRQDGYYTDGTRLYEITAISRAGRGMLKLLDVANYRIKGVGVAAFRKHYWLIAIQQADGLGTASPSSSSLGSVTDVLDAPGRG